MKVHIKYFPQDIIDQYSLLSLQDVNGYIFIKISKGMYGLKQATILAYQQLALQLKAADYVPIIGSIGMWRHKSR